ncbi:pyridoxamine 5'-phosphate oxidase family protein [Nocardia sp. NPDC052001]|uniref:pyridoxamine 5'-phosphate oxidase family protein n=1 Tax=Nocardia sp. NPDC052001 TaxID=3154853 RepID=UPI0034136EB8
MPLVPGDPRINDTTRYGAIAFSDASANRQRASGSINWYGRHMAEGRDIGEPQELDGPTAQLIRSTDSFFLATVAPSGWPYIQHRGGPPGFVHVPDPSTIELGDYSGNQQFVTLGNLDRDNRIALFFIDYPTRTRVKVFGRAEIIERAADPEFIDRMLTTEHGMIRTRCDRGFRIHVEGLDRNCIKNIPVKYGSERMAESLHLARAPLLDEIEQLRRRNQELEDEIARLRDQR